MCRVTLDDFLNALRKAAGANSWFIDQWFFRTGVPDLKLSWKREDQGVKIVIEQPANNIYRAICRWRSLVRPAKASSKT